MPPEVGPYRCDYCRVTAGILLTDGYEPYDWVAEALGLVHAGCLAHARRRFDAAAKASPRGSDSQARVGLDFIRELYRIERPLWDKEHPCTPAQRLQIRTGRVAGLVGIERRGSCWPWLVCSGGEVKHDRWLGKALPAVDLA